MRIREWQRMLSAWHSWKWGGTADGRERQMERRSVKLSEEIGEATEAWMEVVIANGKISEAVVKITQDHPKAKELDLGSEVADVFITLAVFCSVAGIDLESEVEKKAGQVWAESGWEHPHV